MSESPSKAGPFLEGQIPALVSLAHAGFRFFCLANLAAESGHFSGAHLRVPMAQFEGEKSTSCSRRSRGGPRTEETACRTIYMMDREVGGGEAV
jgi:hypothetical protein